MKQKILTMLQMQDEINSKVHPQWRQQQFPWYRAIWTESAELLEHYGWKWWKKQRPDMEQVKLELVDIWHFGLSILLQNGGNSEVIVHSLASEILNMPQTADMREAIEDFTRNTLTTHGFDTRGFLAMSVAAELSFDELYSRYVGKNMLNLFRQDFGYQDGTYQKQWQGREDNEYLVEIVAELDQTDPDFKDQLYRRLKSTYQELVLFQGDIDVSSQSQSLSMQGACGKA